jgi:hypothetical protein
VSFARFLDVFFRFSPSLFSTSFTGLRDSLLPTTPCHSSERRKNRKSTQVPESLVPSLAPVARLRIAQQHHEKL